MPNQPKTPNRTVRIPDDIWTPAVLVAQANNTTVSEVIRSLLDWWLGQGGVLPKRDVHR
jgi:hypothetical protein